MAASVVRWLGSSRNITFCRMRGYYRTFLSEAYRCDSAWEKCRQVDRLSGVRAEWFKFKEVADDNENWIQFEMKPSDVVENIVDTYGIQLLEKFDKERDMSALDVEIFATKLPELNDETAWLADDLIFKFRHCPSNWPVKDSINHAIIKGYLKQGWTEKLLEIMKNRVSYGIFPDEYISCMMLDEFLKRKDYKNAAKIAYEVMLQEEYEHPIRNALSLLAAVKHFYHNDGLYKHEPPTVDEDAEIEYIPVKVVHNQYYDDHFDIVEEQFLLGKTLYRLAKEISDLDPVLSHSLQLLGLGMYNKFKVGDEKMEEWGSDVDSSVMDKYLEYMTEAPTRPNEIPHKAPSERTMEDEYELKRITETEKSSYLNNVEKYMEKHKSEFKSIDIEKEIEQYTRDVIRQNESNDIRELEMKYQNWHTDRHNELEKQIKEFEIAKKKEEIQEKLEKLQEKEELLTYFENRAKILLYKKQDTHKVTEEVDQVAEEEYVEAPGERNVKKAEVKRKKN